MRRVCAVLPPFLFLRWEMWQEVFPEKTPEESDDDATPMKTGKFLIFWEE